MCICVLNQFSHVRLFGTLWTIATSLLCRWDSPGKNTGVGCHALLKGIFPTHRSNPHLLLAGRLFTTSVTWETPLRKEQKILQYATLSKNKFYFVQLLFHQKLCLYLCMSVETGSISIFLLCNAVRKKKKNLKTLGWSNFLILQNQNSSLKRNIFPEVIEPAFAIAQRDSWLRFFSTSAILSLWSCWPETDTVLVTWGT